MRFILMFVLSLILAAQACFADLQADGSYRQEFNAGRFLATETKGNYSVKWCDDNREIDKTNGDPAGSLVIRPTSKFGHGARFCYNFNSASPKPLRLRVEFDYANYGGGTAGTPTTGHAQTCTSRQNTFDCNAFPWKAKLDLPPTYKGGVAESYDHGSFDVDVGADDVCVYIQFHKTLPSSGTGIVMKIDNIVITPFFDDAGQSTKKQTKN